jgi:hypothetical protein
VAITEASRKWLGFRVHCQPEWQVSLSQAQAVTQWSTAAPQSPGFRAGPAPAPASLRLRTVRCPSNAAPRSHPPLLQGDGPESRSAAPRLARRTAATAGPVTPVPGRSLPIPERIQDCALPQAYHHNLVPVTDYCARVGPASAPAVSESPEYALKIPRFPFPGWAE